MEDAVERSRTLEAAANDARYGRVREKELVDRLRDEMEEVVLSAGRAETKGFFVFRGKGVGGPGGEGHHHSPAL